MNEDNIDITVDFEGTGPTNRNKVTNSRQALQDFVKGTYGDTISTSASTLSRQLQKTFEQISCVVDSLPNSTSNYDVDTISFTLIVSVQGKVSLLSSLQAGGSGQTGITIQLKAKKSNGQI